MTGRPGMHPNGEMTAIGYAIGLCIGVVLLPLLPVFLVYVVLDWAVGGSDDERPRRYA